MPTSDLMIQRTAEQTSNPPRFGMPDALDDHGYRIYSPSGSGYETTVNFKHRIIKSEPSIVQNVWNRELNNRYRELGATLSELSALEEQHEWRIDTSVYHAASYLAAQLEQGFAQVPQVFVHGPTSVVFNWSVGNYNIYFTTGANNVPAFVSSPERILRRVEFPENEWPNPVALLPLSVLPIRRVPSF